MRKTPNRCPYGKHLKWKYYVFKIWIKLKALTLGGFPGGSVVKNLPVNAWDKGSIPGLGSSLGEGNGNPVFLPGKSHGQEEAGGLQSLGSQRVGHNSVTKPPPPLTPGHSLVTGPLGRQRQRQIQISQQKQRQIQISQHGRAKGWRATRTWDILSRCLASSLSLAFWKWACSFSSPGVSRYLSTASGVLAAVVGTITQKERRFKESDWTPSHFKRKPYFWIIPEQRI